MKITHYQFESFKYRWNDLHARFTKNRAFKAKRADQIVIQQKFKWKFQINKQLQALEDHDPDKTYKNMFM